jgi:small subunit ribosomal protein S4
MGDPRKIRSKYARPASPWQATRIAEEQALLDDYGLKNKTEVWKLDAKLKSFTRQAKHLIAARGSQADLEKGQLITRLAKLGLVQPGAKLDDVLGLTVKDFLERRLQTLLVRKGLANSMRQARQYIAHEHVAVQGRTVSSPSYLVATDEEPALAFVAGSAFAKADHPMRTVKPAKPKPRREPRDDRDRRGGRRPAFRREMPRRPEAAA